MAESLALTESGLKEPKEKIVSDTSDPNNDIEESKKRSRPKSDSPSPCSEKPPQPQRPEGRKIIPYRDSDSELKVPPSVEKLAQSNQVSRSPFLKHRGHDMTFEQVPKGVKPFRDYLDKDYAKETDPGCAAAQGTLDKLNKIGLPDESGRFTPTFGMTLWRFLRDDHQIILIRDQVNEAVKKSVIETLESKVELGNVTTDIYTDLHSEVTELLVNIYAKNKELFKAQAPTNHLDASQKMFEALSKDIIQKLLVLTKDSFANMAFTTGDSGTKIEMKKVIVEHSNPFLFQISEMVKNSVYEHSKLKSKAHLEDYSNFLLGMDKDNSDAKANTKSQMTNLQAQMASLTNAVAESAQSENDKKIRIRNLGKVITTQPLRGANHEATKANRETRENELKNWIKKICNETGSYKPNFSLYLIDPKGASKQGTTAILTVPLESDKFRIEQIISSKRKADLDLPSSQRFTGKDHPAFNIPKFTDISSKILVLYENALQAQVGQIADPELRERTQTKWRLDGDLSLYVTRKTTKSPFSIYFEFRDPTNNLTLMRYMSRDNPFDRFDFTEEIPNPGTRQKALSDAVYKKRYQAYKK